MPKRLYVINLGLMSMKKNTLPPTFLVCVALTMPLHVDNSCASLQPVW